MTDAVLAEGLVKTFGETRALDGLDLAVPEGTVVGLLGPNGAGKTTAVRVFSTLLRPDGGRAEVLGIDVVKHPQQVRRSIGLTGQFAAIDDYLTGRENLILFGRLYHLGAKAAEQRADELLERFDLVEPAGRMAKTYSGGMRRRLDIAASLVARPQVMFLDEPTTGLDPRGRLGMWGVIEDLVREGTTMLLTTQYLDEADRLADSIAVIDHGRVIARGTSDELKAQVGGARLELIVGSDECVGRATEIMRKVGDGTEPTVDGRDISVPVSAGASVLIDVVREVDAARVTIADLALRRPTLDDVFMRLTGHAAEDSKPDPDDEPASREKASQR
ncbi:MAG TPA: ATP-binding cassette domain-containing protein [Jatrophihabitantaceae bacterium]|nr:ATP-binding cassette domain-containing protein [Jatrophihabitantaceae bacterium]